MMFISAERCKELARLPMGAAVMPNEYARAALLERMSTGLIHAALEIERLEALLKAREQK